MKELIYEYGGGIRNDNKLKAVIPGGSSSHILTAEECEDLTSGFRVRCCARLDAWQCGSHGYRRYRINSSINDLDDAVLCP